MVGAIAGHSDTAFVGCVLKGPLQAGLFVVSRERIARAATLPASGRLSEANRSHSYLRGGAVAKGITRSHDLPARCECCYELERVTATKQTACGPESKANQKLHSESG